MKNVLSYLGNILNGDAAADGIGREPYTRRTLDLCQFEDRIVYSAETQAFSPIDTADLSTGNEFDSDVTAVVIQNSEAEDGSVEPPQKAPLSSSQTTSMLAFPGATGFGAYAQGGRGGDVYYVTNLNDSGEGSLRYGIESMTGPRTILFGVSGTINLESRLTVSQPYLTIAGQSAPGDGITIANHTFQIENTHDIIIRYIRTRAGDLDIANSNAATHDSFAIRYSHDVIVDHVSISWGIDETLATAWSDNVTVQWSIISESLSDSFHPKGQHGLASLSTGGTLSLHHNLYAHHDYRMPHMKEVAADVVNNVFYDWSRSNPSSVGDLDGEAELSSVNFVNNVYVVGPSKAPEMDPYTAFWGKDASEIWADGNVIDGTLNGVLDVEPADFARKQTGRTLFVDSRFEFPEIRTDAAIEAYDQVLAFSGASLTRDEVDIRIVNNVRTQTGGVIDSQTQVGGFPILEATAALADTDQDGMPDEWEDAFPHLDPNHPDDRNDDHNGNGYSNLEEFLNHLAEPSVGEQPVFGASLAVLGQTEVTAGEPFQLTVIAENGSAIGEIDRFTIDWNGDSRTDQTVSAPLGTPLEHVFSTDGDYTVQVQVISVDGQTVNLTHPTKVLPAAQTPTGTNENDSPTNTIALSTEVFLGEPAALTLGVNHNGSNENLETYAIDWNGDSQVDQTVSMPPGSTLEHFYHQPGQYRVQVYQSDSTLR